MLHFVTSYMKQNKSSKQTLESAQYGLEISFNAGKCTNANHKSKERKDFSVPFFLCCRDQSMLSVS